MAYPPLPVAADFTDDTAAVGVHADRHNVTAEAVNEVVTELGPNPKGTFEHVQDRLDDADSVTAALALQVLPPDPGAVGDLVAFLASSSVGQAPDVVKFNWTEATDPTMAGGLGHYEIQAALASDFSGAVSLGKFYKPAAYYPAAGMFAGAPVAPLYFRIRAVDHYGNESAWYESDGGAVTIATTTLDQLDVDAADLQEITRAPSPIVNLTADVATTHTDGTEDDLQTTTLPAGLLAADGDRLEAVFAATCVGHATATRRLRLYFGGTAVMDTSSLAHGVAGGPYSARLTVVRVSASVVRCTVTAALPSLPSVSPLPFPLATYTEITGLTLANTQVLKATGVAADTGAASGDIVGRLLTVDFHPAP